MKLKLIPMALLLAATGGNALCQTTADSDQSSAVSTAPEPAPSAMAEPAPAVVTDPVAPVTEDAPAATTEPAPVAAAEPVAEPATAESSVVVLYTVRDEPPPMLEMTVVNVQFGLLSGPIMEKGGKNIVEKNGIPDPSNQLVRKFAEHFAKENGFSVAAAGMPVKGKIKDVKVAVEAQGLSGNYVVEAAPVAMTLTYFPLDWSHYGLRYNTTLRVVDLASGKVVAEAKCKTSPKTATAPHTHSELLADGAVLLKALIDEKTDECLATVVKSTEAKIKVSSAR